MSPTIATPRHRGLGGLTVRFIVAAAGVYAAALGLAMLLSRILPLPRRATEAMFPPVFWVTTGLLICGSMALQRGLTDVRRERQSRFRRWLLAALALGTLFVGLQGYGLKCLASHQVPAEVQTGANAFLTLLAALHAIHFSLALLFLVWITLCALADRYDHEYHWGVTLCAWFWHALGLVWWMILAVFLIATAR